MGKNKIAKIAETIPEATVPPMVGIGAIALQMAMEYHSINTVQDGTLYQQYKLEGKNFRDLNLSDVFETAMRIEKHLLKTNERVAEIVMPIIEQAIGDILDSDENGIPLIQDSTKYFEIAEALEIGDELCLVGFPIDRKSDLMTLRFANDSSTCCISVDDLIAINAEAFDNSVKKIYVKRASSSLQLIKIEDYHESKISIEEAIELVMSGKCAQIIGLKEQDVFLENRAALGDNRAAFAAFASIFEKQGMTKAEVEDEMSSRQIDSVAQLVTEYIFSKYE